MKVLSIFAAMLSFFSQSTTQQTTSIVQRDPQALAILNQAVSSSGGLTAMTAVQDFTGTGTITYSWAGQAVPATVVVYEKGVNEFRMDATLSDGVRSLVIDGIVGSLTSQNGQQTKLPFYSIMTSGSLTFPFPRIAATLTDSSTSVTYIGPVPWNNSQAVKLHVVPPVDPSLLIDSRLKGLGEYDLYFDPTSYRLLELGEEVWWGADLSQTYSHEILFSNYVTTGGLAVPFVINERFGGQQTWSVSLSSVTFNSGLSDALFTP